MDHIIAVSGKIDNRIVHAQRVQVFRNEKNLVFHTKQPSLRAAMERVLQRLDARLAKRGRR
ncbi:MAG: hypothetical protein WCG83_06120 [Candidatus Peregrinibacteria bacterium]